LRRLLLIFLLLLIPAIVYAQSDESGIDVIDVSGPLDSLALEFMSDSIHDAAASGQELAVLQIDSPAVLDGDALDELISVIENPPLPLAVWVGPAPATAFGGVTALVLAADEAAIAPGSTMGLASPVVAGEESSAPSIPVGFEGRVTAEETGLSLQPTIRQFLQALDGVTLATSKGPVTVETLKPFEDGVTLKTVTFQKPGLATRFFRLAATPEAAFFFLVVGLTIASFEFFAIGPGVAAGVAGISLILASWGVVNLPVRPWALGVAVVGWALLTMAYQRGGVFALTLLGTILLQAGGMWFVDGSGQIDPRWYLVLPSVLAALFFFLLAMPTVQRARFSTRTIGREGLIGEKGVALVDFDPDGLVEVRGARWRATAHREAGIGAGDTVTVAGVDGMFLELEPVAELGKPGADREN
jgi:membrane-bound serine protease (ClpP class)